MTYGPRTARLVVLALMFVASWGASLGYGQATWSTQVLIPDMLTIRVPTTVLAFAPGQPLPGGESIAGLSGPSGCPVMSTYPPPKFPACYPLQLSGGSLPVDVFSNIRSPWSLLLDVSDLTGQSGTATLPAHKIWYRVGNAAWQRAGNTSNPLYFGSGATDGYLRLNVQFMLEMDGNEYAGSFTANAVVSAIRQP